MSFNPNCCGRPFAPPHYPADNIFIGTDINLYYDSLHPLWQKRPDWFVVLGVPRSRQQQELRWSYVVWDEGRAPFLVLELLSPGTEAEDLGRTPRDREKPPTKWEVYEQILRIPYYVVFDRYSNRLRAFRLVGTRYEALLLPGQKLWFDEIELGLGVWQGEYEQTEGQWLRWYDAAGNWLPTLAEQVEEERQRADRLAAKLRELGINF